ncbi:MAG TPA: ThiF family adenylyltransferase [Candidatus Acidoferrales bacterium]|nr:ThiF family adenylyltransferase [Candidatus Acidoferrales bacterium]
MEPRLYEKYSRQILFAGIGEAGQQRLLDSSAVLVGCGALGTVCAGLLVRAGIGRLRIIDRDFVELSNLQRQSLFEESDARDSLPKAVAAERRLRSINSDARIESFVRDLTPENAIELLSGFPLILDGTDNFESRMLINDTAVTLGVPWIYAAVVGSYGVTFTIRPGQTACLACLLESAEGSRRSDFEETCDTAGILNSVASLIASIQAAEAVKLLSGNIAALNNRLVSCDAWKNRFQSIRVARNPSCRACAVRKFTYLEGQAQPHVTLCGRNSVQIHERRRHLDLIELSRRLERSFSGVRRNDFLLRFAVPPYEMTVFSDGRAVIKGTHDPAVARSLYARFVGA